MEKRKINKRLTSLGAALPENHYGSCKRDWESNTSYSMAAAVSIAKTLWIHFWAMDTAAVRMGTEEYGKWFVHLPSINFGNENSAYSALIEYTARLDPAPADYAPHGSAYDNP